MASWNHTAHVCGKSTTICAVGCCNRNNGGRQLNISSSKSMPPPLRRLTTPLNRPEGTFLHLHSIPHPHTLLINGICCQPARPTHTQQGCDATNLLLSVYCQVNHPTKRMVGLIRLLHVQNALKRGGQQQKGELFFYSYSPILSPAQNLTRYSSIN